METQENKKKLITKESLTKIKRRNVRIATVFVILFSVCIIFFTVVFFQGKSDLVEYVILIILLAVLLILPLMLIISEKKQIKKILKGDFKIIEDEIYDRYAVYDSDTSDTNIIFTKIYGKIDVTYRRIYYNCQKDSRIFLLITNRKKEFVDECFLKDCYEIDESLKEYLIPYDEKVGQIKFNEEIEKRVKSFIKYGKKIKCKNCCNKYKIIDYEQCPKCNLKNTVELKDIMEEKSWY